MKYESEFYVGYLPVPRGLRRRLRRVVGALFAVAGFVAVVLVAAQGPFAPSVFEYAQTREFEGMVIEHPYPALVIPGEPAPWLLVGPGKHGAAEAARGLEGQIVRLTGSRIYRGADRMLEVSRWARPAGVPQTGSKPSFVKEATLRGEIVDTKCFFGVMNPGNGKVHRDCATRCIAGGIPPGFRVRDRDGEYRTLLLTGANGEPLHSQILDYVAEPVTLSGQLFDQGGRLVLRIDPSRLRHPE